MEVEYQILDCYKYEDSENEDINERACEIADIIVYNLGLRMATCQCNIDKYVISLLAEQVQKANCSIITGCPHFRDHLLSVTGYVSRNFLQ